MRFFEGLNSHFLEDLTWSTISEVTFVFNAVDSLKKDYSWQKCKKFVKICNIIWINAPMSGHTGGTFLAISKKFSQNFRDRTMSSILMFISRILTIDAPSFRSSVSHISLSPSSSLLSARFRRHFSRDGITSAVSLVTASFLFISSSL